jgi:hypothetical protein
MRYSIHGNDDRITGAESARPEEKPGPGGREKKNRKKYL